MFHFGRKNLLSPVYKRYSTSARSLLKPLYSEDLRKMGIKKVGEGTIVDPTVRFINISNIEIGANTRIDAFTLISASSKGISIGDHVHIGSHTLMVGSEYIHIGDFTGLSGRVSVYSSNDDYSGDYLTGPTVPMNFRNVTNKSVIIGRHSVIGSGSVILPGINIGNGVSVGSLSFINQDIPNFKIAVGSPIRILRSRSQKFLELEKEFTTSSE